MRVVILLRAISSGRGPSSGRNSQLCTIAEVYACDDAKGKFDFGQTWNLVVNGDRVNLG